MLASIIMHPGYISLTTLLTIVLTSNLVTAQSRIQTPSLDNHNNENDYPSVSTIIELAIERAKLQDDSEIEFDYVSLITTMSNSLNGDGIITKTETALHKQYAVENFLYQELIEQNGSELAEKEKRKEEKRQQKFIQENREKSRRGKTPETNDERQVGFDRELMERYTAVVEGIATIQGEPCWVLAFKPRPGKLPTKTRMDKALNRSTGKLYITKSDYGVAQIEFAMQEPIKYLWGVAATLRKAVGRLEFERVTPNVWMPKIFDFEIEFRVLFRTLRRQIIREWTEHRLLKSPVKHIY